MKLIIEIIKTVLGKDTSPTEINKPWYFKRRYWGLALTIAGSSLYSYWGLVLDNTAKDMILDNLEVIKSSTESLISAITALWGIYVTIRGQRGNTKKIKVLANTLAVSPPKTEIPFPEVAKINEVKPSD